jgi:hypothetical protein
MISFIFYCLFSKIQICTKIFRFLCLESPVCFLAQHTWRKLVFTTDLIRARNRDIGRACNHIRRLGESSMYFDYVEGRRSGLWKNTMPTGKTHQSPSNTPRGSNFMVLTKHVLIGKDIRIAWRIQMAIRRKTSFVAL